MNTAQLDILLVEDSIEDVDLIRDAFAQSPFKPRISVVTDGQKALDFLHKRSGYQKVTEPNLILLDLNLPRKSGHEVLAEIKSNPRLKAIPVVILTTSRSRSDVMKCYQNYTNCYICKPLSYDEFSDVIQEIESYWLSIVELPGIRPERPS